MGCAEKRGEACRAVGVARGAAKPLARPGTGCNSRRYGWAVRRRRTPMGAVLAVGSGYARAPHPRRTPALPRGRRTFRTTSAASIQEVVGTPRLRINSGCRGFGPSAVR